MSPGSLTGATVQSIEPSSSSISPQPTLVGEEHAERSCYGPAKSSAGSFLAMNRPAARHRSNGISYILQWLLAALRDSCRKPNGNRVGWANETANPHYRDSGNAVRSHCAAGGAAAWTRGRCEGRRVLLPVTGQRAGRRSHIQAAASRCDRAAVAG